MANLIIFPASLARSIAQTIASAAVGGKGQAGCAALATAIGPNYRLRIRNGASTHVDLVFQNAMTATGGSITLPAYTTLSALVDGSVGSGWVARIGKADDSVYVEGPVGFVGSGAPFILTANPDDGKGFAIAGLVLRFDSAIDASSAAGTLEQEYARAMTDLNDFPPGNLQNTTWPSSRQFSTSPWGSNVDQMHTAGASPATVQEGKVIPTGANRVLGWLWFMPPKNQLSVAGNWRIETGYVQMAGIVDSLSNPWNRYFGPVTPDPGYNFTLSDGSIPLSGNLTDSANTDGAAIRPFENNSPLNARIESSQTISIRNVGRQSNWFQLEINVPDGDPATSTLPANMTSSRTKAFAGCFWARIIKDNPSGAEPPDDINLGGLMGLDCYGPAGRVGNPGWGRLRRLTKQWRPFVMAFVLNPNDERYPMSRTQIRDWLTANPPPFTGPT